MTTKEFSDEFDTLVYSYGRNKRFDPKDIQDSIEFDEYEKSVFLTKAQNELVISLYSGKNVFGDSFEKTEELRRSLDNLVKTAVLTQSEEDFIGVSSYSKFYNLPTDCLFITLDWAYLGDENSGCHNGNQVSVTPVTQDEWHRIKDNPFRTFSYKKALRLDNYAEVIEVVSKYDLGSYVIRYVKRPNPIVLTDFVDDISIDGISTKTECELDEMLHRKVLETAVQMALASKAISNKRQDTANV